MMFYLGRVDFGVLHAKKWTTRGDIRSQSDGEAVEATTGAWTALRLYVLPYQPGISRLSASCCGAGVLNVLMHNFNLGLKLII
jgi:hypothetical protein